MEVHFPADDTKLDAQLVLNVCNDVWSLSPWLLVWGNMPPDPRWQSRREVCFSVRGISISVQMLVFVAMQIRSWSKVPVLTVFFKFTFGCQPLRIMSSSLQRWSLELGSNLKTCEFSQASSIMLQWWSPSAFRFNTNPNVGGGEKLLITLPAGRLAKSKPSMATDEISTSLLDLEHVVPPMGLVMVKGWTRTLALYSVMAACYEETKLLEVSCFRSSSRQIGQLFLH